jgi:hypothetical protein
LLFCSTRSVATHPHERVSKQSSKKSYEKNWAIEMFINEKRKMASGERGFSWIGLKLQNPVFSKKIMKWSEWTNVPSSLELYVVSIWTAANFVFWTAILNLGGIRSRQPTAHVAARVARWFVFKPTIQIRVKKF